MAKKHGNMVILDGKFKLEKVGKVKDGSLFRLFVNFRVCTDDEKYGGHLCWLLDSSTSFLGIADGIFVSRLPFSVQDVLVLFYKTHTGRIRKIFFGKCTIHQQPNTI